MQKAKTILFVHNALALWGGIERIWIDRMNFLADECGYKVYIATTDQGTHRIPYAMSPKIQHVDFNIRFHTAYSTPIPFRFFTIWKNNQKFKKELRKLIHRINPSIITSTTSQFVELIQSVRGDIPYIIESHSGLKDITTIGSQKLIWIRKQQKKRYLRSISKASILICLTEKDAEDWKEIKQSIVIPNAAHLNPSDEFCTSTNKRVIFAGRFSQQKGIKYLIEIWKKTHEKHPDWQLDIYGEGEDKPHWVNIINSYPDKFNINVFDPTPNIFDRYRESSIFVLTSVYEPFGLVIPEAMSCGLPVISFRSPYGPESIIDYGSGILVDCYDTDMFAKQLCLLIENPEIRRKMGKNAIQSAQRYSINNIMSTWLKLYDDLTTE